MVKIIAALLIVISLGGAYHVYTHPHALRNHSALIPRSTFIGKPGYGDVTLSPDGNWIGYLAPKDGTLNIWVRNLVTGDTKALTADKRDIYQYAWAYDNQHILYLQDQNGDENWQLYKVDIQTGISTLLTPEKAVQARIIGKSHHHPDKILVGLNHRDPAYHDIYAIDIKTGTQTLVLENKEFSRFVVDDHFNIIFAVKMNAKGETLYYQPKGKGWTLYRTVALDDLFTEPLGTDVSQAWVYWFDSEGTDKTNLVKMHLKTKERKVLAQGQKADVNKALIHPLTKEIISIGEYYLHQTWTPLIAGAAEDFKILHGIDSGDIWSIESNLDGTKWIVTFMDDQQPVRYYLYDRTTKKATFLFYYKQDWVGLPFVKMQPLELKSRDGLTLVSYLSIPNNAKPGTPLPMILLVHSGPNERNKWGMDFEHQWLANRGYAVLSVNFRGSIGLGKSFIKASYGEWGGKMHEDLIDAVNWAIQERIADPKKIAIYGFSYGGYAALVGATMTPDVFACAVDRSGISNLITFLENFPPYWKSKYEMFKLWLGGDPATENGKAFLRSRSPMTYIENIKKPLLIVQGTNDPRIKKSESDQIVHAMTQKDTPVTYLLFPDEGHQIGRPENMLAYWAAVEVFLHQNLGGLVEPMGDEAKKSTMQVVAGKI